ncbi:hypothetical protein [Amycolatopsis sp. WGS_07]|uniref:hypothetical protein n=1 Tax=Amycolatopsis sp. WGS_07 TaxID=3076764 RepID=UPI003873ACB3
MDARENVMAGVAVTAAVLLGLTPATTAILLRQPTVQSTQQQARAADIDDLASVHAEALLFESDINLTDRQLEDLLNDLGADSDD